MSALQAIIVGTVTVPLIVWGIPLLCHVIRGGGQIVEGLI